MTRKPQIGFGSESKSLRLKAFAPDTTARTTTSELHAEEECRKSTVRSFFNESRFKRENMGGTVRQIKSCPILGGAGLFYFISCLSKNIIY
jgi:hypothetical protein